MALRLLRPATLLLHPSRAARGRAATAAVAGVLHRQAHGHNAGTTQQQHQQRRQGQKRRERRAAAPLETYPLDDPRAVTALIRQREEARRRHDWGTSDKLRDKMVAVYGATIDDGGKERELQGKIATYTVRRGPLGGQTWRAYIKDSTQVVVKSSAKKSVARRASSSSAQSSNYRGVSWQASKGQWRARIKLGGKNPVKLGLFDSEVDAARAYDAAAHQAGRVHDANFGSKTAAEAAATAEAEAAAATTTPPTALLDSSGYQRASLPGDGRSPGEEMVPRWMLLGAPGAGKGTYSKALSAAFGGVPIVGTGDMLRAVIASGSDEGKRLAAFSDKGQLVPDEDVLRLLGARLAEPDVLEQGFMLDGFPRTVGQAEALGAIMELTLVLNIVVPDEHVVAKLLGRSGCDACGASYNTADVCDDERGVYMPPILPKDGGATSEQQAAFFEKAAGGAGGSAGAEMCCDCGAGALSSRADDTAEVIENRLATYHAETAPLVDYYRAKGVLVDYRVCYGVGDMQGLHEEIQALLGK